MRPTLLLLPVLALIALPTAAEAKKAKNCAPKGAKTIATGTGGKVVTDANGDMPGLLLCTSKRAKPIRLDDGDCNDGRGSVGEVESQGRYLAYTLNHCGLDGDNSATVHLIDVPARRLLAVAGGDEIPATTAKPGTAGSRVYELQLDAGGTAAWIGGFDNGTSADGKPASVRQVLTLRPGTGTCPLRSETGRAPSCRPTSPSSVLDTGDIDPASLRLTGGIVSWTNSGAPKSAPLPS